jgi:hypothetical protein
MTTIRAVVTGERGDDNVTAVIVIAVLLFVALTVFQTAAVFLGRTIALEAARDGVDTARIPPTDLAAAVARAKQYTAKATGNWMSTVDANATSDGQTVSVTVTAQAASFVPFLTIPVSQTASGPIEQVRP